ncbi:MAG TPA: glutathione S-transferase family protein [Burkholderiales bacterium]|jgi:glutathione S-transferase|nr:glutathione S-transferase family protein [Burkholderiales bacterium]
MLKIWGRKNSLNVQKVLWCCAELNLDFERIDAGLQFGVNNTPEYKAINPNALVPTINDDGFVLWESHAIVRYLARKHGMGTLCPSDPKAYADADRWMDWHATTIWPNLQPVFRELVRVAPDKRDMPLVGESRKKVAASLAILDAHLAARPYVAGAAFTMGDIPLGTAAQRWFNLPIERENYSQLDAWYQRLLSRPAFKQCVDLALT